MKINFLNFIIPVELVIFGFDGVMLNTTTSFKSFLLNCFSVQNKYKVPGNCFSNCGKQEMCRLMRTKYKLPYTEDELNELLDQYYGNTYNENTILDPDFNEYMQYLKNVFIKQAICTTNNIKNIKTVFNNEYNLKYLGWDTDYFEIIRDNCDSNNYKNKLKNIADELNIPYNNCILFDDHKFPLTCAKEIGMRTCAIKSSTSDISKKDIEDLGCMYIKSFKDLLVK